MNVRSLRAAVLVGTMSLLCGSAAADGFKSMAREFSRAAARERLTSVAVLPLVASDTSDPAYGRVISEKLVTELVRDARVRVVERARLDKLLDEQRLDLSGAIAPGGEWKGQVLAVQALVVGAFASAGTDIVFNVRVVEVKSGMVLAARAGRVPREDLAVETSALARLAAPLEEAGLVDAVADTESLIDASCAETQWRIDQLESRVLELKARSWAARLRKGESMSGEDDFPGSAISNPELKQTLYDRINAWYAEKEVPGLTLDEQEQLRQAERQARILSHRCRI